MKRWEPLLGVLAAVAGLLGFIFLPLSDGVHNIAQFLNKDPKSAADLTDIAGDLLYICALEVLVIAGILYTRRSRVAVAVPVPDSGLARTYPIDEAVQQVLGEVGNDDRACVTVVGYSLSFAESLRLALHAQPRPNLDIHLAVPSERYIEAHCREDKEIAHRISHLRGRLSQWEALSTTSRVRSVKVSRYECAPNLFAFMADRDVIYYGRYPFENTAGGTHALQQNLPEHRLMQRVDEKSSQLLFHLMLQTIDAQFNC